MSHRHYCDFAGHDWECANPECMCFDHAVSMEDGDHGRCRIELRACPEHQAEQQRSMAEAQSSGPGPFSIQKWLERPHCECGCADAELRNVLGFCVRCAHVYVTYSPEIEARHFAHHCPGAPEALKESARDRLP